MSTPEAVVIDRGVIRTRLRKSTQKEFTGAHTKIVLIAMCATLDVKEPGATKDLIYDQLVANAGLPDQSLRGGSTTKSPVAAMWSFCETMYHRNDDDDEPVPPRRKDIIAAAKAHGIAHHTARTQYQSWWTATLKGTRLLKDVPVEELPRALQPVTEDVKEA